MKKKSEENELEFDDLGLAESKYSQYETEITTRKSGKEFKEHDDEHIAFMMRVEGFASHAVTHAIEVCSPIAKLAQDAQSYANLIVGRVEHSLKKLNDYNDKFEQKIDRKIENFVKDNFFSEKINAQVLQEYQRLQKFWEPALTFDDLDIQVSRDMLASGYSIHDIEQAMATASWTPNTNDEEYRYIILDEAKALRNEEIVRDYVPQPRKHKEISAESEFKVHLENFKMDTNGKPIPFLDFKIAKTMLDQGYKSFDIAKAIAAQSLSAPNLSNEARGYAKKMVKHAEKSLAQSKEKEKGLER